MNGRVWQNKHGWWQTAADDILKSHKHGGCGKNNMRTTCHVTFHGKFLMSIMSTMGGKLSNHGKLLLCLSCQPWVANLIITPIIISQFVSWSMASLTQLCLDLLVVELMIQRYFSSQNCGLVSCHAMPWIWGHGQIMCNVVHWLPNISWGWSW